MKLNELPDQVASGYPEVNLKDAILRVLDVTLTEQASETWRVAWEIEVVNPGKDIAGNDITDFIVKISDFLPKNGLTKSGKNEGKPFWKWSRLKSLAKKLSIDMGDFDTETVSQEFFSKFKGRAYKASLKGERKPSMRGGEPVMQDDGITPKTFVDYSTGDPKEAAPKFDVSIPA